MRLHTQKSMKRYSAEYGKVWTKEITPRTKQDIQLYGWLHNYPYHNQNDLTWWADRRRPRHTVANYALRAAPCSIFASLLLEHENTVLHQLSIGGGTTLLLPTDFAFGDKAYVDQLRSNPDLCRNFLLNHIVSGELTSRSIGQRCRLSKSGNIGVKTKAGKTIGIKIEGSFDSGERKIMFGPASVLHHGMKCSNGVVFVLDGLVS
jgi:uncharacterized surface protein with fasciclin (FAS1) repeats